MYSHEGVGGEELQLHEASRFIEMSYLLQSKVSSPLLAIECDCDQVWSYWSRVNIFRCGIKHVKILSNNFNDCKVQE